MKNLTQKILFSLLTILILCSCSKWLDVNPQTQVKADVIFETQEGFKSALDGIYISMGTDALYGRELTFGLVDHIAQIIDQRGSVYTAAVEYDYDNVLIKATIDRIWINSYNAIVNINMLLSYIDNNKNVFRNESYYEIIKAEALALRAYIHFDLLRLYAPSPAINIKALSIPYITEFKKQVTPQHTIEEVLNFAINDLNEAAALLKPVDPIVTGELITLANDNGYLMERSFRMNYYAVKALTARVALYKGDEVLANTSALEVINSNKFKWVNPIDLNKVEEQIDRVFAKELVFTLFISDMSTRISPWFNWVNGRGWDIPSILEDTRSQFYEGDSYDFRSNKLMSIGLASQLSTNKLLQPAGIPDSLSRRLPMIRITEMYYIAAETDLPNATTYLDTVRFHRGIPGSLPKTLTNDQIQNEIYKEYLKEFFGEGQVFYYYKRKNITPPRALEPEKVRMILPMPDVEIDFGKREISY